MEQCSSKRKNNWAFGKLDLRIGLNLGQILSLGIDLVRDGERVRMIKIVDLEK